VILPLPDISRQRFTWTEKIGFCHAFSYVAAMYSAISMPMISYQQQCTNPQFDLEVREALYRFNPVSAEPSFEPGLS
jgi:hypothetical protein